jgi:acylphosphatase
MKKSVKVYFSGLVQGIFFRAFVKDNADRLNINGFVRNLEDGRVEAFFEGDGKNVDKILEVCSKGPKHSKIKKVEVKQAYFQEIKGFKILHI